MNHSEIPPARIPIYAFSARNVGCLPPNTKTRMYGSSYSSLCARKSHFTDISLGYNFACCDPDFNYQQLITPTNTL